MHLALGKRMKSVASQACKKPSETKLSIPYPHNKHGIFDTVKKCNFQSYISLCETDLFEGHLIKSLLITSKN